MIHKFHLPDCFMMQGQSTIKSINYFLKLVLQIHQRLIYFTSGHTQTSRVSTSMNPRKKKRPPTCRGRWMKTTDLWYIYIIIYSSSIYR